MGFIKWRKINKEKRSSSVVPAMLSERIIEEHIKELNDKIEKTTPNEKKEENKDKKRLPLSLEAEKNVTGKGAISIKELMKEIREEDKKRNEKEGESFGWEREKRKGDEKEEKLDKREANILEEFSFFNQLEKTFKTKEGWNIKDHLNSDLVKRMKNYHETINKGTFIKDTKEIEEKIEKKLKKLKELESEWIMRNKEYQEAKQHLLEKEKEIERNIYELKEMIKWAERLNLFKKKCEKEKGFRLSNVTLYSILELLYELERMPDEVFYYHVSEEKNDFAKWIEDVFGLSELAEMLRKAKSKEETINVLKNY